MNKINLIAACSDFGIHVDGSKLGPEILIKNSNVSNINKILTIHSNEGVAKELDINNKRKNLNEINFFNTKLYNTVLNSLNDDCFPITLGGDHSIAIASALASIKKYNNLGIIWFDAHGDFNTFKTTISGNIHGLPLAVITNYEKELLSSFHNGNYYNYKNTVIVGARDLDSLELENLKNAGVTIFSTEDIKKYGTNTIYSQAFKIAGNGTNGIHVSYDIDVIDPIIAPGVSIPAIDGISVEEANCFVDFIHKNKNLVKSIDLVELNPLRDIDNKTQRIATNILNNLISIEC
jgi:arginase